MRLLIFLLLMLYARLNAQQILGIRIYEDSIFIDEVFIEDCTTKKLRSHVLPSPLYDLSPFRFYFGYEFMIHEATGNLYFYTRDYGNNYTQRIFVYSEQSVFPVDTIKSINSIPVDGYILDNVLHLVQLANPSKYIVYKYDINNGQLLDSISLQFDDENLRNFTAPKAYSSKFCVNYYIDRFHFSELFITQDEYGDFRNLKLLIELFRFVNQGKLHGKTEIVENIRDCYFPDLLLYNREIGIQRMNIEDKSMEQICDLSMIYDNMYYVGEPETEDCLPLIDLHDDGCEWPNRIDNSHTLNCYSEDTRLLNNYPKIFSPSPIDSIIVQSYSNDEGLVSFIPYEYDGISYKRENNRIKIVNETGETKFLAFCLNGLRYQILEGNPRSINFTFLPYLNGREGYESQIKIDIKEYEINGDKYTYTIERGNEISPGLYKDNDSVIYSWFPNAYLSCTSCPDPVIKPIGDIDYLVSLTSINGCQHIDTVSIQSIPKYLTVNLPNIINPQSSTEVNKYFFPRGNGIASYDLEIANRAGQLIYSGKNIQAGAQNGWDGKFGGQIVPQGVYVYSIVVYPTQSRQGVYKDIGTVTVIH